jgi:ABC-type enterobactin transport system permease subunit
MQRSVASNILRGAARGAAASAARRITLHLQLPRVIITDFYSAAQHLLGAAFAAVGGTPKGVYPLRAA